MPYSADAGDSNTSFYLSENVTSIKEKLNITSKQNFVRENSYTVETMNNDPITLSDNAAHEAHLSLIFSGHNLNL